MRHLCPLTLKLVHYIMIHWANELMQPPAGSWHAIGPQWMTGQPQKHAKPLAWSIHPSGVATQNEIQLFRRPCHVPVLLKDNINLPRLAEACILSSKTPNKESKHLWGVMCAGRWLNIDRFSEPAEIYNKDVLMHFTNIKKKTNI